MLNAESVILAHYDVVSCCLTLPRSDATASSVYYDPSKHRLACASRLPAEDGYACTGMTGPP